jgi:hypothetical protein
MVFAKTSLFDAIAATTLEVNQSGMEKDRFKPRKKITPMREHRLFYSVLGAARAKGRCPLIVLKRFTQEPHCAVKMMKIQTVRCSDVIVMAPFLVESVGTRYHQAVQHGKKNSTLYIKLELSPCQHLFDRPFNTCFLPQAFKDLNWPDLDSLGANITLP